MPVGFVAFLLYHAVHHFASLTKRFTFCDFVSSSEPVRDNRVGTPVSGRNDAQHYDCDGGGGGARRHDDGVGVVAAAAAACLRCCHDDHHHFRPQNDTGLAPSGKPFSAVRKQDCPYFTPGRSDDQ
eukprot:TRINITY_DN29204_c0_g1_i1.p1 TRINITY_DN29204_c0_g1~~TRINITY_DN29204_c0_g1_i1.p1  ORF type:complete len:135 (+),score=13.56 TRINITY_DN29204_c0_g1_i1:28-405(+)